MADLLPCPLNFMSTPAYFDIEVRFFSRVTGLRLPFNPDDILSVDWELVEAGGAMQISLALAQLFDLSNIAIQGGDTLEVWALGTNETVPRCRGAIGHFEDVLDLKETKRITAYGRAEEMNHVLIDRVLLVPGGADLSQFAAAIADDYQARRPGLSFVRDIQPTGVSLERLEQANATARGSMDQLYAQAGGNITWGWDIDPATGLDRFYLRPKTARVGHQFFVGGGVKLLSSPSELQNIVNGIKIQGGPAKYPQLMQNPSFEMPSLPDVATGSLLTNGSFENPPNVPDDVRYVSGASRVQRDGSGHNASPHSGDWYAILDHGGEEVYWDKAVVVGTTYRAALYAARESGASAVTGRLVVEGRASAGGAVLETYTLPLAPASTAWTGGQPSTVLASDGLSLNMTFGAGVTAARVRVIADGGNGIGDGHGLLIDDVTFGPAGAVGQPGWSTHVQHPGSAANNFNSIDWACRAAAWDGFYGVRLSVTADASDRPALAPAPGDSPSGNGAHYKPAAQQSLRTGYRVRMAPGLATATGSVTVEYREWASDGHETQFQSADFAIPNDGAWHFVYKDISAHGDADTATTQLTFSASGWYDVDGATARDRQAGEGDDPADVLGAATFLRGASFEKYVTAEAVCLSGSAADVAAATSFATYGRREAVVSNDQIVDWNADARQWAAAFFGRSAVPLDRPQCVLNHEPVQKVSPGDGTQVRVSGLTADVQHPDLQDWCPKALYQWARQVLGLVLDMSSERPTWAKLLLNINSSGGGSASSIASGGGGGGSTTPAAAPVQSVNAKTGAVVLAAADVGAEAALGSPATDGYVLTSTVAGARAWKAPAAGFFPSPPVQPTSVEVLYIQYLPGSAAMGVTFAAAQYSADIATSLQTYQWQSSIDGGTSWRGYDGTSATTVQGISIFPIGIDSGKVRARVRAENAAGVLSDWTERTADVAYIAPPSYGSVGLTSASPAAETVGVGATVGTASTAARADHVHALPGVFGPSGNAHAAGFVPDPGSAAGTTRFLREDGSWTAPPAGNSGGGSIISVSALPVPNATTANNFYRLTAITTANHVLTGIEFDGGISDPANHPGTLAFDGDPNTYVVGLTGSAATAATAYLGLDLGASGASNVTLIRYAPRPTLGRRMISGIIEGSNLSQTSGYVTIATLPNTAPPDYQYSSIVPADTTTAYRWLRYRSTYYDGSNVYVDIAELEFTGGSNRAETIWASVQLGDGTFAWKKII